MPRSTRFRVMAVSPGCGLGGRRGRGWRSWTDSSAVGIDPVAGLAILGEPAVEFVAVEEEAAVVFVVRDFAARGELVEPLLGPVEITGGVLHVQPRRQSLRRRGRL